MTNQITPGEFAIRHAKNAERLERSLKIGLIGPAECLRAIDIAMATLRATRSRVTKLDLESRYLILHVHFASTGSVAYYCKTLADARRYYIDHRNSSGDDVSREGPSSGFVWRGAEVVARITHEGHVLDTQGKEIEL